MSNKILFCSVYDVGVAIPLFHLYVYLMVLFVETPFRSVETPTKKHWDVMNTIHG